MLSSFYSGSSGIIKLHTVFRKVSIRIIASFLFFSFSPVENYFLQWAPVGSTPPEQSQILTVNFLDSFINLKIIKTLIKKIVGVKNLQYFQYNLQFFNYNPKTRDDNLIQK